MPRKNSEKLGYLSDSPTNNLQVCAASAGSVDRKTQGAHKSQGVRTLHDAWSELVVEGHRVAVHLLLEVDVADLRGQLGLQIGRVARRR